MISYIHVNPVTHERQGKAINFMKNQDISKKILKKIAEKRVASVESLKEKEDTKDKYAISRSLKNLVNSGFAKLHDSGNKDYISLTKEGKKKLYSLKLDNENVLVNTTWDGYWRMIILDLPEARKNERESLRYLLKKAGFVCLKNSVWISPLPYEYLFENIKRDLGLTTEMIILTTNNIDLETQKSIFENFKN